MWQRFTERARRVVFFAQEEAKSSGGNVITTQHLLLGLVGEDDTIAANLLSRKGITITQIRDEIAQLETLDAEEPGTGSNPHFTPCARRVFDMAHDEARLRHNDYIGTEHLLLGMIRVEEGAAGRILAKLGFDLKPTREKILRLRLFSAIAQIEGPISVEDTNRREQTSQEDPDRDLDFDALHAKYQKRIFSIIYRFIGDYEAASDLTQETFISAHRHFDAFRGEKKVFTWLYQIARSLCLDRIRQRDQQRSRRIEGLD